MLAASHDPVLQELPRSSQQAGETLTFGLQSFGGTSVTCRNICLRSDVDMHIGGAVPQLMNQEKWKAPIQTA